MSENPASPQAKVDLPFGHSASLERTETGATLMVRTPGGDPTVEVEILVTAEGASLRKRAWSPRTKPRSSVPPPVLAPSPGSGEPRLSVQQYASLRAECVSEPAHNLGAIRARYGLDEEGDHAEAKAWGKKFAQEPAVFDTYKRLFQQYRGAPTMSGATAPTPSIATTQALARILSLGEHATMTAELRVRPESEVYAKYDLSDPGVRAEVLKLCETRLEDPTVRETWRKLHDLAVRKLEGERT
jgi:hypothetical protein